MRDKIELDARYISSNADIWYFINSCLDSGPQQVVATFYAAGGPGGQKDSVEFLKYLDRTYKDLNIDLQAATTLRTLRQRDDQSLSSFLPWFERTLAEAGGADWADKAKIAFLEGALSTRLKRGLIYIELPKDDYHRWLLKVQDFAIKLESLPQQAHKGTPPYSKAPQPGQQDADGDMAMSGVSRAKGKERARPRRQRSSSSSSEDLQQPKKDSRCCYNCNQISHIAIWCPRRKPLSPTKAKKVKKVKKDPKPEGSSNDNATEEPGSSEAEESLGKE
ncbi:hypothetical protein CGCA056_v007602 [Colletotrichum aenigma]|uniref:uncharacterized protein n=1 Tax=Colletotrichum aenigma TaxID=1215731 RepID=UPI001872467E|nr:uncharacterized protein CGCA056_v007602 [Colletotrichum aenigma]KAF5521138.1 hypothetical protein CGCA056_v007602 [Colletotrichum aenigma]